LAGRVSSNLIAETLRQLPSSPGVYLMKDAEGKIIYVGKAANLPDRVRSYFGGGPLAPKIERMVGRIADIEFFVTRSEQEALILENNLIKRYHPYYNVRLRDDKTFPYLKISLNEEWPRVYFTRRFENDGGRYFGPFASARSVRQTLKALKNIFPFRTCTKPITGADSRACLEYHLGRCVGPCIGAASREEYAEVIKQVILFLEGNEDLVVDQLEKKMQQAAEEMKYETAASLRDEIQAIHSVIEGQHIAASVKGEQDVIALALNREALAQVFFVRRGRLIGRESYALQGTENEPPAEIMTDFVKQFYASSAYVPPLLLLQHPVEDAAIVQDWLKTKRGGRVDIQVPKRGPKKGLVDEVAENARQALQLMRVKRLAVPKEAKAALEEVQRVLKLPHPPRRIEGYDISNIQGKAAVGSMVVSEDGKARPAHYRRFRIKTVPAADDYAMLQEVLRRRFKRASSEANGALANSVLANTESAASGETWAILPDLILIDGGKGQLNAVLEVFKELGVNVPAIGLAKEFEEIFVPGQSQPIRLPGNSAGLQLLQRLRDEAHRFALGYHLKVRRREGFESVLDSIPGVGPKRKRALLRKFGSVRGIREASLADLMATDRIPERLARSVKEYLQVA
jgi:excinuclease ABC subunit C